jgi:D-alanyl-D-alanine carboxypeptidase
MSVPYKNIVLDKTLKKYGNGKLPAKLLKKIKAGGTMYEPAACLFNLMYDEARKDGIILKSVSSGYRTYESQESLFLDRYTRLPSTRVPKVTRKWKGHTWNLKRGKSPSATPGFSPHGWGLAQDLDVGDPKTFAWLCKNGPRFGFYLQGPRILPNGKPNPEYEAWHWQQCHLDPNS